MNLEQVKKLNIPASPGCYQYLDKAGRLLYIGKAANLKARVFSYWQKGAGLNPAKKKMLAEIDKIKIITVDSEIEALLLEANLIKKFQPPYNIVMRDDKRHQYIKITNDEYPRVLATRTIVEKYTPSPGKISPLPACPPWAEGGQRGVGGRGVKKNYPKTTPAEPPPTPSLSHQSGIGTGSWKGGGSSGRYFGPFTSGSAVRETLKAISKIFPYGRFITMSENKANRQKSRRYPEIYGAPNNALEYKKIIKQITTFLEGKRKNVEKLIELQIKNYLAYRQAGELKIKTLKTAVPSPSFKERAGVRLNILSNEQKNDIEDKIKSLKYRLLNMRNVLAHSNVLSVHDKYAADVVELAKILGLPKIPQRIEGYDVSNLFGQTAVGSMVVFAGGESDKKEYRKFKIKSCHCEESAQSGRRSNPVNCANNEIASLRSCSARNDKKDDTAMLKEILERRFNHLPAQGEVGWPLPDLIIIDGGRGQLNAGLSVLKKIGLSIPIIAISKGEGLRSAHAPDKIFFPNETKPLQLSLASPALHIIKRVRDEAHRFAIAFYRQKKNKKIFPKLKKPA